MPDYSDLIRRARAADAESVQRSLGSGILGELADAIQDLTAFVASQPADPVTNAGCCQAVKVKPLVWGDFANISASPDNDATMDDNLAVALCSYFDMRMDCPDDDEDGAELDDYDCWKVWVSENAERVLRRIAGKANEHILAAIEPAPATTAEAAKVLLADKAALATLVDVAEEEHDKGVSFGVVISRALRAIKETTK